MNYAQLITHLPVIPEMIAEKALNQATEGKNLTPEQSGILVEIVTPRLIKKFEKHFNQQGEQGEQFREGCKKGTRSTNWDARQYLGMFMFHWAMPFILYSDPRNRERREENKFHS